MTIVNGIKLFDENEVMKQLNISKPTMNKYKRQGLITFVKIGRFCYISENSLNAFVEGLTTTAAK